MEATGAYWLGLACALHSAGYRISVVNPSRTAMFARSQLRRTKTDRVDADMIADFCKTQDPAVWTPPPSEILEMRGLLAYRDQLVEQRIGLKQMVKQLHVGSDLRKLHAKHIRDLDAGISATERSLKALLRKHPDLAEQLERLTAVAGIGFITAVSIIAKLPVERLRDGKAAAAYIGVTPRDRQSGTSVHGKARICKTGNGSLRRDLYMPALVAMRFNPILRTFAERLLARGKQPKVVVVAVIRKLIVLAFNLLTRPQSALAIQR